MPGDQATEGSERKVSILIGELMPGELYNFEIYTSAHRIRSEKVKAAERTSESWEFTITARKFTFHFFVLVPIITSDLTVVNRMVDTTSFTVRYTPTPFEVSTFDTYRFVLSDPSIPVKEKDADDSTRKVGQRV